MRGNRVILVRTEEGFQRPSLSSAQVCAHPVPSPLSILTKDVLPFQDMFAVAVSLVTGKIMYISNQVASIFHCKRDTFHDAKFVEFLAPHDISVFHSSTTPYKLPPWSVCSGTGEGKRAPPTSPLLETSTAVAASVQGERLEVVQNKFREKK